jgi:hypothetical protein
MALDTPAPARSPGTVASGPARARVARLLRDERVAQLRCRRAAVYLPGLLGGPRLLAVTPAEGEASAVDGPSALRIGALRAAHGVGCEPVVVEFMGDGVEPAGKVLVVPLAGELGLEVWAGSLVLFREKAWTAEELAVAIGVARLVYRALGSTAGGVLF